MFKKVPIPICYALVIALSILASCNSNKEKNERPIDTWVFRSVLDKKPRMATVALDDNMWLAYDTQSATLYKAWKGGVNFDGAVYTTKHGPQPTSLGYAYQTEKEKWVLLKDNETVAVKINYKGHRFENDNVVFKYELETPEKELITIEETPKYVYKKDKNGLERTFTVLNQTGYKIGLETTISSLENEEDYSTNGTFSDAQKETVTFDDGTILEISGTLLLNGPSTFLTTYYHPGFDQLEKNNNVMALEEEQRKLSPGALLIEGSDCKACHNEKVKTVGPSYLSIAEKYPNNDATIALLGNKIKTGGNGVWGEAMMTAHPDLPDADAAMMASYILSLDGDDNDGPNHSEKYTLGIEALPLNFSEETKPTTGKGLVASLFTTDAETREAKAYKSTVIEYLHLLDASDFGEHQTNIRVVFRGQLNIDQTDSYDFRLISDDGSYLFIDDKEIIDNGGYHGFEAVDGEAYLEKGIHEVRIEFEQGGGGAAISLQWFDKVSEEFELVPVDKLSYNETHFEETTPYIPEPEVETSVAKRPGDQAPLEAMHPSFTLYQARPNSFEPRVGGIDFIDADKMIVSTWDAEGSVFSVENYTAENPEEIKVKKIASGLAEPLGVKVVDGDIYVLQKQELTKLIDHNGDEIIDEYQTVSNNWRVSDNFHEFAFGLQYKDGHFYAALATAILPGGASAVPQIQDRGKVVKINKENGATEFIAHGLRTPNGIGMNTEKELFIADNQGDWLPASKIVHIQNGEFYGSRSVNPEGTKGLKEKLPVVWLPQDEIGNSPSEPTYLNIGPYKDQLIHGEVTHGGIKRVAYEEVEGQLQGVVFRFIQGVEAGVNRIRWAPDGSLVIGGIGVSGNWQHYGKLPHGLQRITYNGKTTFEMLKVNAMSDGFKIEFTEPLAADTDLKNLLQIEQWYYLPTNEYGGPKLDHKTLRHKVASISENRKTVFVTVDGLKENHVVYFHLNKDIKSATGQELWTTEAWYTLNRIPQNRTVALNQ